MIDCHTRYPLLFVHGLNGRDDKPCPYFGRIPAYLSAHGARVYLGEADAWGTIADNGRFLYQRMIAILQQEKCAKLNIIAHSKGGLDARYLISTLNAAPMVASLTTIATPHYGSRTAAHMLLSYRLRKVSTFLERFWRKMGDQNPQVLPVLAELTPATLTHFNAANPNVPDVYYQSWGLSLNNRLHDPVMALTYRFLLPHDAENDGLVSPQSARWGHWRGTIRWLSHCDITDCRQKNLAHFHTLTFYHLLARQLANLGY